MARFPSLILLISLAAPLWARDVNQYALVLAGPPAASMARRENRAAFEAARVRVQNSHESVKAALRARQLHVSGEVSILLNAVFVAADSVEAAQLASVPGVSYVAKMPRYRRTLDAAEQLINVPAAWTALASAGFSNAGAGIKIAIIDTGIDNTHAAFQDSSLTVPRGFPVCDTLANCAFTNSKIIAARSFVSYLTNGGTAADSRPDDLSVRDRVGHGTAVAMAAAGNTNSGPADTITGVAPKAFLGNYKVFGSPDVNDSTNAAAIISAVENAYYDGMDIAQLSLGGAALYGPLDSGAICGLAAGQYCDLDAYVLHEAVGLGMTVVVAAGNSGPGLGSLGSPGDAPDVIAVSAISNGHTWSNGLTVSGLGNFHSQLGDGPAPGPSGLTAPLSDIANVGDPLGCAPPPSGSLAGTIALVARGTCTFVVKVQSAQAAGAVGAIITDNVAEGLLEPGGLAGATTIPATLVSYDDGQSIRNYLKGTAQATATMNATLVAFPATDADQMTTFSSRGPVLSGTSVKPDVSAVGANIFLAAQHYDPNGELYSSNGYIVSQGTSFAAPQIAGLAALVKQANPGATPALVKSAIVNTATADVTDGGSIASVMAAGSGRANAGLAVTTTTFASPASVSFGVITAGAIAQTPSQGIVLTNSGSVQIAVHPRIAETTAHVSFSANQTGITVMLSGTLPPPGIYEGYISVGSLQIPYAYIVPDGVPATILAVAGNGDIGNVGQSNGEGGLLLQVLDHYGVPVANAPVSFSVTAGGGTLSGSNSTTNVYGYAESLDTLGPTPGTNVFTATAGGLTTTFSITAMAQPTILPNGAVNAANFTLEPASPGSYIALFGNNFTPGTATFSTPYLPLSLGSVTVSFDTPLVSAPGHLFYVSPGQLAVQVPWELQTALAHAETSVQMKVSYSENSGAVYNLPLGSYSPAFFENPVGFVAALDHNNVLVTSSHGAAQGTVVQLFLNGLGPVSNQPASGDPASATVLANTTATPTVMIGSQNAQVIFSGLTPGALSLYQVNAVVPQTGSGLQTITISIGGVTSAVSHIQVQ